MKTGQPMSVSEHDFGNRACINFVGLASLAAMPPMTFRQEAGNLEDRCTSGSGEDAKRVAIATSAFDAPFSAAEALGRSERLPIALFGRGERDPIDHLADCIEEHRRVRALVTIDACDDAHAHLR
jgi:hypothetical protein